MKLYGENQVQKKKKIQSTLARFHIIERNNAHSEWKTGLAN